MSEPAPSREPSPLDPHDRAVRADYDARVGEWQNIYEGETYHDHLIRERLRRTLAIVDQRFTEPAGRRALDVGCGAGQLLVALGTRGFDVSGVDIAPGMVEAARERLRRADVVGQLEVAGMTDLPHSSGSLDLLTGLGAIEYVTNQRAAVREFHRVLAPGGYAVITSPNPFRAQYLLDPLGVLLGWVRNRTVSSYPRRYRSAPSLVALLEEAGFEVVSVTGHGLSPVTFAGRQVVPDATAIQISGELDELLPPVVGRWFGANLIAVARRPGLPAR